MTIKFSKGKFVKDENGRIIYTGKVPEGLIGREVMILEESDLDLLVRGELPSLLTQQIPMDKELYDGNQPPAPFLKITLNGLLWMEQKIHYILIDIFILPTLLK